MRISKTTIKGKDFVMLMLDDEEFEDLKSAMSLAVDASRIKHPASPSFTRSLSKLKGQTVSWRKPK